MTPDEFIQLHADMRRLKIASYVEFVRLEDGRLLDVYGDQLYQIAALNLEKYLSKTRKLNK